MWDFFVYLKNERSFIFYYLCLMDKKELILKTTLKLVNEHGFYHLNMKQLAVEAGISVGTTYLYFDSKEKLINELYKNIIKEFNDKVLSAYQKERSFKNNFFEMMGAAIDHYIHNSDCFSFIEQYTYSPFLFKETQEENLAILEPIQKIIKEAKKSNELKDLPDTLLIALAYGPIVSMMKLFIAGKTDLKKKTTKEQLLDACWLSISI
jgi:AcrR family transcriptional regulator